MTFILFILMIGILIAFHELGHMLVAKLFNVYVREFAIGFGPKIFSKQGKETLYSLRLIPLGGYTGMIESEEEEKELADQQEGQSERITIPRERTFYGINPLKRICILIAGPLFNLLLASLIFVTIFEVNPQKVVYPEAVVASVTENSPAMQAGIQKDDEIIAIEYSNGDKVQVDTTYDLLINNQLHKGAYTVTVIRDGQEKKISVTPTYDEKLKEYIIGVIFAGQAQLVKMNFAEAFVQGIKSTGQSVALTIKSVLMLFTGNIGLESVSGTIGMYSYTQEAISYGFLSYLSLVGSISISLAVMNLIPIPVFDGGRVVLTIVEMIIGHRINKKVENIILYIGMGLIFALFILTTVSDITKIFN